MNDEWLAGLGEYVEEIPPRLAPTSRFPVSTDDLPEHDPPYGYHPQSVPPWTPALVFDVALGLEGIETILSRHDLTEAAWEHINSHPLFHRQVGVQARELSENGVSFRAKAKVQAEMYLVDLDHMISSPTTDQKVKLDAIKYVTKVADLEPRADKTESNGAPQVNIQINLQ